MPKEETMEEWGIESKGAMFKEIMAFKKERDIKGYSILQVVMMYCEEMEKDIDEVGELLKKDKSFRETFQEDLKFNHEAVFSGEKKVKMSEWL
jgi:hypothetical protein